MSKKLTIKLRFASAQEFRTRSESYQILADVLGALGGHDDYVGRRELIAATNTKLAETGATINNVEAAVSSMCALPGIEAVVEHPDGRITPFTSRRLEAQRKKSGPAVEAGPEVEVSVSDANADQETGVDAQA